MSKAERVVVYAGLALAIGLGLNAQRGASPAGSVVPAAMAEGSGALVLAPDTGSIATVDMFDVISRLFQSDKFKNARESRASELNAQLEPLQKELQDMQQKFESLPQDSPERLTIQTDGQAKAQQFEEKQTAARGEMEKMVIDQLLEAYGLAAKTAESVATSKGLSMVVGSVQGDQLRLNQSNELLQEVLRRPIVRGGLDITADVRKELGVENVSPTPTQAPPADPNAPAGPPAGGR